MMENTTAMPGSPKITMKRHVPWALLAAAIFLTCFILSLLIPPLQSPDEGAHLERIYLLGKGQLMLETPEGSSSGGMIDSGLRAYLQAYSRFISRPDIKMSQVEIDEANNLRWTGHKEFDAPSGTGYYFPLIYTPQAMGLAAGEALGFTVDTSYRMARFFVLVSTVLVLAWAFLIHRPPIIAVALLVLPMSLFQFASASLDGMSTAVFILAVSCFSKIAIEKKLTPRYISYLLIICVILVTSSRAHAMPLFALIFASYFYTKDKRTLAVGLGSFIFVVGWLLFSIKLTKILTFQEAPTASTIVLYYLKDPLSLVKVLYRTITDHSLITFYLQSFAGILGWLDTRFSESTYYVIYFFLALILVLSLITDRIKNMAAYQLLLTGCSLGAILLTFFALLIQWNALQHPAVTIQGVQGRYFLIPALLLAYAVGSDQTEKQGKLKTLSLTVLIVFFLFSVSTTCSLLISRYFLVEVQPTPVTAKIAPTLPLSPTQPISLNLDQVLPGKSLPLRSISIMFATYVRVNQGDASISMKSKDGEVTDFQLDLTRLKDNKYNIILLDDKPYSAGEIKAKSGGGVSVWQAEYDSGSIAPCVIYEFSNGAKRYTKGCPRP